MASQCKKSEIEKLSLGYDLDFRVLQMLKGRIQKLYLVKNFKKTEQNTKTGKNTKKINEIPKAEYIKYQNLSK